MSPLIHKINKGDLSASGCELLQALCKVQGNRLELDRGECLLSVMGKQEADGPNTLVRRVGGAGLECPKSFSRKSWGSFREAPLMEEQPSVSSTVAHAHLECH